MPQRSVRLTPDLCPKCGKYLDAATLLGKPGEKTKPAEGDFTVCIQCATVLRYGKLMALRMLIESDRWELPKEVIPLVLAVRATMLTRPFKAREKGIC